MRWRHLLLLFLAVAGLPSCALRSAAPPVAGLAKIQTIVVLYAENRSFDNLYGLFPGAHGIEEALSNPALYEQRDRDGSVMRTLPPVWRQSSDPQATPEPDLAFPANLPNRPFRLDAETIGLDLGTRTRDLVHRFYQNQEQIDGGKNDQFAAISDAGGLTMGYYDGSSLPLWKLAREYTLADNFFMGAFGGSFLNHFWLVCACTPQYPQAGRAPRARLDAGGKLLRSPPLRPRALDGPPLLADGAVTPDGYAVNTLQPPYQPSGVPPARAEDPAYAEPNNPSVLPAQTATTIGDTLTQGGIDWAWYSGAWRLALADGMQPPAAARTVINRADKRSPNFVTHHTPFNYFARFDPKTGAAERSAHLKDEEDLVRDIKDGTLPPVTFYKPSGIVDEHPGYTDVLSGDRHIAALVRQLQESPQWQSMVVIVAYDENGGFWDHVAPPKGDAWGPGNRIPAIVISPFAKRGYVDHTMYDTTSILKLISERFGLAPLAGIRPGVGDLTTALNL